ncbi:receptor-type tyrosine-protein phosphatase H-like isoform X2 [Labrus bergylta]|uniref:receptor-type tyrosine-protein phosphatase H-like isoform X2 n=1 Tax=Labrus bergylta TaxID=56723 RepID=UPI0033133C4F
MMKPFFFKIISDKLLLGFFLCLLWCVTDSNTTSTLITATTPTTISTTIKPPDDVEEVTVKIQDETSITLTWNKVNNLPTYFLKYDDKDGAKEKYINQTNGELAVVKEVSHLTAGTVYHFTVITTSDGLNSSGKSVETFTRPRNADNFKSIEETETSITLQWEKVENNDYLIKYGSNEKPFTVLDENPVKRNISGLTTMTEYNFTLFTVFKNTTSRGVHIIAFTAPPNPGDFKSVQQNETSITLQWEKVNGILNYTLKYNETEINVAAEGLVSEQYTISGLTSGTKYQFSLFAVFENVRSSGVRVSAVTAPPDTEAITIVGQTETSITLQWTKVDDMLNYTLVFDGSEIHIPASEGNLTTVSNLTSMTIYHFTLFTVFENVQSSGVRVSAVTAPPNTEAITVVGQNETSITLQWTKVDDMLNYTLVFDGFEIHIPASEGNLTTVSNLTSMTIYHFTLFTVFENVQSSGATISAVTAPPIKELKSVEQTETSITLRWKKVENILNYVLVHNQLEENVTASKEEFVTKTIIGLMSGTKYDFSLFALFHDVRSSGLNYTAATVPSPVALVNVTERSVDRITLVWENVRKDWTYTLQINGEDHHPEVLEDVVLKEILRLKPGTEYTFRVTTKFFGHNSSAFEDFTVTTIDCAAVDWKVTNSSITGTVEGLFSNATASNKSHSHVSPKGSTVSFTGLYPGATYKLFLIYEKQSRTFEQCKHTLTITPPDLSAHCEYLAAGYSVHISWNRPAGLWTAVEVNVAEKTHIVNDTEEHQVQISEFKPTKTYKVSVAALSGDLRSSTPFVFSCQTDPRGVIARSVMGVLLFAVLVCMAAFILLKRPDIIRRNKTFIGGPTEKDEKPKTVPVEKFPDHFYQLSVDDNRGFSQEYESLMPVGTEQTRKEANLLDNKPRNRFNNVLPYDWCRVKLTSSDANETSGYINANYMPGYNSSREYIATQGPLPSTVNDFWRMIWEQRVKGIVMVTNCKESGKAKCEQYWPGDSKPHMYGELVVTIRYEQKELFWILREFTVKHKNSSEERTVKHFHFTAWPDHGVPQGTEVLIQFRGLVRQHIEREGTGAPTVVHCSTGVGRTGTIIALDVMLQQLEKERAVSINAFVHKMRLSRPHMVQTKSQYVFLHQCIMDSLQQNERTAENIYENDDMIYANATALLQLYKSSNA